MAKDLKKIKIADIDRINLDNIITDEDPTIRKISFEVPYPLSKEDKKIMHQMIDYVRSSTDETEAKERNLKAAYGISAIQLGYPKKMLFARIENDYGGDPEEFALINPKIIEKSSRKAYLKSGEGCLSVRRDYEGYIMRSYSVKIVGIDYFTDREIEISAKGLTAVVLQHEMDHLIGVLFYDRLNKLKPFSVEKDAVKI